jgi:outer membrane protein OmpA-like peptidoglycan-associated protein
VLLRHTNVTIMIEGHAKGDKQTGYLMKLSEKRAAAVLRELVAQGVDESKLHNKGCGADGVGMKVLILVISIEMLPAHGQPD